MDGCNEAAVAVVRNLLARSAGRTNVASQLLVSMRSSQGETLDHDMGLASTKHHVRLPSAKRFLTSS